MTDPIVEEVRAVRARIADECGYDLGRILDHARRAAERIPGITYVTLEELRTRRGDKPATAIVPPTGVPRSRDGIEPPMARDLRVGALVPPMHEKK